MVPHTIKTAMSQEADPHRVTVFGSRINGWFAGEMNDANARALRLRKIKNDSNYIDLAARIAIIPLLALGVATGQGQGQEKYDAVAQGKQLFQLTGCNACHSTDQGAPQALVIAPSEPANPPLKLPDGYSVNTWQPPVDSSRTPLV